MNQAAEMLGFPLSREWPTNPRRMGRGRSRGENSISNLKCEQQVEPNAVVTLVSLCLASLESSLGKGLAILHLDELPVGLAEQIYDFIFLGGSRMAKMEVSKALAPILQHHVDRFDCSRSRIGNSALLQLANGCGSALMHLNLSECPFVADSGILGVMLKCPSINILSLSGCNRLSDQVAHYLPHRLPGLTRLDLAGVQGITESGVAYISFLPALEQLCLARCKISDAAVVSLGAGVCRHSIRWLDLTGTGVRDACIPSLGNILLLEYIALSSTSTSISAVAALARDLRLPAMLPEARKTRARSNRTLLLGSRWSEQHRHVPKRTRRPHRRSDAPLHHEHGSSRRGWAEERSKALRLIASANDGTDSTSTYGVHVKIGFREDEEDIERSGRGLVMNLVQGIVELWPAEPIR